MPQLMSNESGELYWMPTPGDADYVTPKAPVQPPPEYNPGAASYQSHTTAEPSQLIVNWVGSAQ